VHICTGPVAVHGAQPGDVLEVRILDAALRPCANPRYRGRAFKGSRFAGS
jgi:acetamidase/formamidase